MTTINEFFLSRPALTAGLVSHLWQSSVVALVILGLLLLSRSLPARTRRALAALALAKFVLPVAALLWLAGPLAKLLGSGVKIDRLQVPALLLPTGSPSALAATAPVPTGMMARNFWGLAAGLWLAGFVVLLGYWAWRAFRLRRRLLAEARPLPEPLARAAAAAARRMGLSAVPRCRSVAAGHGPGVLGVLSPVVLLPCGLEVALRPSELEAILIHEFTHVRRRDSWWKFLQMLLVSAFWYHPLVWLLQHRLNLEAEKSCDERVLAITADPDTYARGIVKTVRFSLGLPQVGFAGAAMPPVAARLRDILGMARRPDRQFRRGAALGFGVTLLAFSGYAGTIETPADGAPAPAVVTAPPAAVSDARVYAVGEVDQPPVATYQPRPQYPFDLKQQGLGGEVVIGFTLNPQGRVQDPAVVSSTSSGFEAAALQAVSHWRFRAGRKDGAAVNVYLRVPILFSLNREGVLPAKLPPVAAVPARAVNPLRVSALAVATEPSSPRTVARTTVRPTVSIAVVASASPVVDGPQIFEPSMLDVQPKATKQPRPHYPFAMKKQWISGEVVIGFIVDATGAVTSAHVLRSTRPEFESEALGSVSRWQFKPGKKGGLAVSTRMQVPIVFTLNNES